MAHEPPAAPDRRFGKGLRMASVVLAATLAAAVGQVVLEALLGSMDVPLSGDTGPTAPLRLGASMGAAALSAGAALILAALLLPRVTRAVRVTQAVGVGVYLVSLVRIALSWGDLASPFGLVLLHTVVAATVLLGLGWAMDDVATVDA